MSPSSSSALETGFFDRGFLLDSGSGALILTDYHAAVDLDRQELLDDDVTAASVHLTQSTKTIPIQRLHHQILFIYLVCHYLIVSSGGQIFTVGSADCLRYFGTELNKVTALTILYKEAVKTAKLLGRAHSPTNIADQKLDDHVDYGQQRTHYHLNLRPLE